MIFSIKPKHRVSATPSGLLAGLWLALICALPVSAQEINLDDLRIDVDISDLESELGDDIREFSKSSGLIEEAPEEADLERDQLDVLQLKREVMRTLGGVLDLEHQLLYPQSSQWVVLLATDPGARVPQSLEVRLDGKTVHRKSFTKKEQAVLAKAAVYPAQLGYVKPGSHQIEVRVRTAKGQGSQSLKIRTREAGHFVETRVKGRGKPQLTLAHWGP